MADQSLSSVLCSEMGPSLGLATLLLTLTLASTIALPAHHQLAAKVKCKMFSGSGLLIVRRVSEEPVQHLGGVRV